MFRIKLSVPLSLLALVASAAPADAWMPVSIEYPSTLVTCGERCESGMVVQATSLSRPLGHLQQPKVFQWYTSAPLDHVVYQIATKPFTNARSFEADGLIAQRTIWTTSRSNTFPINFGATLASAIEDEDTVLSEYDPGLTLIGLGGLSFTETLDDALRDALAPKVFYVRMFPMAGSRRLGPASNTVVFTFQGPGQTFTPYVLQHAYDVEIVELTDMQRPSLPYGCVYVDYVPFWLRNNMVYKPWYDHYVARTPMCPRAYRGRGEPRWYESMWDFVSSSLSWVSEFYADLKTDTLAFVVNTIQSAIGVEICGETCLARLETGLDVALITLGIPPELPNADKLINDGKAYIVEEIARQAGAEDCEPCKAKLREAIDELGEMLVDKQIERLCGDVDAAHRNGREPLCVPAGVSVHPAPESSLQFAHATVRVRRNYDHPQLTTADLEHYRLDVTTYGYNYTSATLSLPTATCFGDGYQWSCGSQPFATGGRLEGPVFLGASLQIPPLAPGESLDIPLVLEPHEYWVPSHEEYLDDHGTRPLYNDWNHLYDDGVMQLKAQVSCPSVTYGNNCRDTAYRWMVHMGR